VQINGTPGGQLLPTITVFSCAFRTSAFYHPPSCLGINSPPLFTPTFGAHCVPSSKTTLVMPLRRMSQHLHPNEGPLRESTNNHPRHKLAPQTSKAHWLSTYNSHHGLCTTEQCHHQSTMATPTPTNFSCVMKLP
jgi:hypothetical protein